MWGQPKGPPNVAPPWFTCFPLPYYIITIHYITLHNANFGCNNNYMYECDSAIGNIGDTLFERLFGSYEL